MGLVCVCFLSGWWCIITELRANPLRRADASGPCRQNTATELLPVWPPAGLLQKGRPTTGASALPRSHWYRHHSAHGSERWASPGPGHAAERHCPAQPRHTGGAVCAELQESPGQAAVARGFQSRAPACERGPGDGWAFAASKRLFFYLSLEVNHNKQKNAACFWGTKYSVITLSSYPDVWVTNLCTFVYNLHYSDSQSRTVSWSK